jgi:hypothetical protein
VLLFVVSTKCHLALLVGGVVVYLYRPHGVVALVSRVPTLAIVRL